MEETLAHQILQTKVQLAKERGGEVTKIEAKELEELGMTEAQLGERRKQLERLTGQKEKLDEPEQEPKQDLQPLALDPWCPAIDKHNRHVRVALNHLHQRRDALLVRRKALIQEIEELEKAILALK